MKNRKKYLVIGIIVMSVVVIAGLGLTAACGPHGRWHKGCFHGFHSSDVADFILWKMDRHVKALNLDERQMSAYEEIKDQFETNIADAMQGRREFHDRVYEEMRKENPDLNALAVEVKNRLKTMPEIIGENVDLFLKLYNDVLNPEQKTQLIEMLRSRMG